MVKYNQMECSCKRTSCLVNKMYYFGLLAFRLHSGGRINTSSLFRPDPLPSRELETNTSKFNAAALYCRIKSGTQCLEEAEQQAEASVDVPYPPLQIVNLAPFCLFSFLSAPFLNPLFSPSPPSLLSLLINSLSS